MAPAFRTRFACGHGDGVFVIGEVKEYPRRVWNWRVRRVQPRTNGFKICFGTGPAATKCGLPLVVGNIREGNVLRPQRYIDLAAGRLQIDSHGTARDSDGDAVEGVGDTELDSAVCECRREDRPPAGGVGKTNCARPNSEVFPQKNSQRGARVPGKIAILLKVEAPPFCKLAGRQQTGEERLLQRGANPENPRVELPVRQRQPVWEGAEHPVGY